MKIEKTRIHFFSDVFSAVAVLGSEGLYYFNLGRLAANSGRPWILQVPNPHFSDAVISCLICIFEARRVR